MILSFEEAVEALQASPFRLNNLWQNTEGRWIASLRDEKFGYEFASGESAAEALREALRLAKQNLGQEPLKEASSQGESTSHEKTRATSKSEEELGL